jgi:hypothetical protein
MAGADCRGRTQQDVCVHGNRPRTPPCSASSRARVRACAGAPSGLCLLCVCSVPRLVPCLLTGMTLFKALTAAWPHASCLLPPASSLLPPPSSLLPLPSSLVPPLSLPCPSLPPLSLPPSLPQNVPVDEKQDCLATNPVTWSLSHPLTHTHTHTHTHRRCQRMRSRIA